MLEEQAEENNVTVFMFISQKNKSEDLINRVANMKINKVGNYLIKKFANMTIHNKAGDVLIDKVANLTIN